MSQGTATLPVPPPDLMYRVSGGRDADVFLASGRESLEDFKAALAVVGKTFADYEHVLDYGCGCGRVLRYLLAERQGGISGSDYDAPAIAWVRENLPGVDAQVNGGKPPLKFPDNTFDLIFSYSVFSHFDEEYQDAWLAELRRVAKPGATVLLTTHGDFNWAYTREHILHNIPNLAELEKRYRRDGHLYFTEDGWEEHFPDFYHTAWHSEPYIRRRWGRFFDVVEVRSGQARPTQDMVILTNTREATTKAAAGGWLSKLLGR
ncbi:class I SAM-dependent methyltransferase [Phenylobacterium sp.]|jgi:SAM-dependent methyltransferase|uniref:class I SAM-dependent methyltransferase n=1 Tax=Phenylobacterium sp. TaxID=1871053 RepID=UPI002F958CC7